MFEKQQSLGHKGVTHLSHNDADGYAPQVLSYYSELEFVEFKHCSYDNFETELEEKISFFENHDNLQEFGLLITDISPYSKELVERLAKLHKNGLAIVLLDHHDTAKWLGEENPDWAFVQTEVEGTLTCGTELYYKYLLEKDLIVEKPLLTSFVEQIRSYDVWDWDRVEPKNTFAKELNSLLYALGPAKWLEYQVDKISSEISGEDYHFNHIEQILVDVENKAEAAYIRARSKNVEEQTWKIGNDKYNVGVVFGERYHSVLGNELHAANEHLDFVAMIDMHGKKVSLRTTSDDIHVGKIAKAIGTGGGHQKAAGFQLVGDVGPKVLIGTLHEVIVGDKHFF